MRKPILLMAVFMLHSVAIENPIFGTNSQVDKMVDEHSPVALEKKMLPVKDNSVNLGKSLIRIPEVTMDGHTLHFVTPCTGLTLQLVQADEVCYETVITSDYLEIPADFTGVYELQILRGEYVFYAEIEL